MSNLKPRSEELDFFYRWLRYTAYFNLGQVLSSNNIKRIAIYGGGVYGTLLYEHLADSIAVEYIVDKSPTPCFTYNVPIIHPSQAELLRGLDAVIITVRDCTTTECMLSPYIKCIPLDKLIISMDEYMLFQKVIGHISKSNATLLFCDWTNPPLQIKNPSYLEKIIKFDDIYMPYVDPDLIYEYFTDLECYSPEYVDSIMERGYLSFIRKKSDFKILKDVISPYYNVVNHCRLTTHTPDIYENTIHFFGNCVSLGLNAEDQYTIESYLQRLLNTSPLNGRRFRVLNQATINPHKEFSKILSTSFLPGDYIIVIDSYTNILNLHCAESQFIKYISLAPAFNRPHEFDGREIFLDNHHINHRGYKLIANKLYDTLAGLMTLPTAETLKENAVSPNSLVHKELDKKSYYAVKKDTQEFLDKEEYASLTKYVSFLKAEKSALSGAIGSIVMNCNPFTLGHRFLIEEALKHCDFLYIFIVEEDKSYFPFKDRMTLVKEGVSDLKNIKLLPSGQFIISTLTFPEYFVKGDSNATIDASLDISIFAEHIAPILNITKRFAGEEPLCLVTKQYNQAMKQILPQHGIEFIAFERKTACEEPISASRVRKLIDEEKIDALKSLLPDSTYDYICKKFFRTGEVLE